MTENQEIKHLRRRVKELETAQIFHFSTEDRERLDELIGLLRAPMLPAGNPTRTSLAIDDWRGKLPHSARVAFDLLVRKYPEWVTSGQIASALGVTSSTGGRFISSMGTLIEHALVIRDGAAYQANEFLFTNPRIPNA